MAKAKDYSGMRFGHWTVLSKTDAKKMWLCRCDCGNVLPVNIDNLKRGKSTRCNKCKGKLYKSRMTTHGESKTRLYYVWLTMRNRCIRKDVPSYSRYGGRGIKVCEEWMHSYTSFRDWALGHGYAQGLEIDRIDNNGDYCPSNCRWVDHLTNMQNTRINKLVKLNGKEYTSAEIANHFHISGRLFRERLRKGWSVEEAVKYKPQIGNNQTLRGDRHGRG